MTAAEQLSQNGKNQFLQVKGKRDLLEPVWWIEQISILTLRHLQQIAPPPSILSHHKFSWLRLMWRISWCLRIDDCWRPPVLNSPRSFGVHVWGQIDPIAPSRTPPPPSRGLSTCRKAQRSQVHCELGGNQRQGPWSDPYSTLNWGCIIFLFWYQNCCVDMWLQDMQHQAARSGSN